MTESEKISGVDPSSYGSFDKSVDWMSNHLSVILPVVTMGSAAMAACDKLATENPPAETATMPASATPTPFVEMTPNVETTEAAEPLLIEWDSVELEIAGRPVEFVIGKEEGVDLWSKWGIESIEINENMPNYQEKMAKMLSAYLWQNYLYQSFEQISYDEFLQNPEKYKINLVSQSDDGEYLSTAFSLDQVKRFEMRYIQRDDSRLYFSNSSVTGENNDFGYKFRKDGTLIMYLSFPENYSDLDYNHFGDNTYFSDNTMKFVAGSIVGDGAFNGWIGIGYTRDLASPEGMQNVGRDAVSRYSIVWDICDYPTAQRLWEGAEDLSLRLENLKKNISTMTFLVANPK